MLLDALQSTRSDEWPRSYDIHYVLIHFLCILIINNTEEADKKIGYKNKEYNKWSLNDNKSELFDSRYAYCNF